MRFLFQNNVQSHQRSDCGSENPLAFQSKAPEAKIDTPSKSLMFYISTFDAFLVAWTHSLAPVSPFPWWTQHHVVYLGSRDASWTETSPVQRRGVSSSLFAFYMLLHVTSVACLKGRSLYCALSEMAAEDISRTSPVERARRTTQGEPCRVFAEMFTTY